MKTRIFALLTALIVVAIVFVASALVDFVPDIQTLIRDLA